MLPPTHAEYRKEVLDFVVDVGLGGIETDGQFEGLACADESHGHHHNGLAGGWAAQLQVTLDFNRALKARGLYQTGADGYVFSGAQRYNHADTDAFGRLPLWERSTVGRLYVYDSTMTRLPTSGQINVGDLVSAVSAPAATAGAAGPGDEHGGRLRCLDFALMALASVAGQPYIHASRLYDPDDPDARAIATILARWTASTSVTATRGPRERPVCSRPRCCTCCGQARATRRRPCTSPPTRPTLRARWSPSSTRRGDNSPSGSPCPSGMRDWRRARR